MKVLIAILLCILSANYARAQYRSCLSPNQVTGYCVNILQCPTLYSVLQNPNLSSSVKQFMKDSRCGTATDSRPLVCCTRDTDFARTQRQNDFDYEWTEPAPRRNNFFFPSQQNSPSQPWSFGPSQSIDRSFRQTDDGSSLLPQPPTCGGLTVQHRIYGGEDADLNEFPWMALMEYRRNSGNGLATSCAGSLINQRYILTAAHCLTGRIEREIGTLVSVLLGEYDTRSAVDCPKNGGTCAPASQRYGVAEVRVHELYKSGSPNQAHDIGLARLDRNVRYTENVRPICLPSVVAPEARNVGQQFMVAGWGRTLQATRSPIKQKLAVNYVDPSECRQKFAQRKIDIMATQICAGGKFRQDSCDGDSGGPLMRFRDNSWVLEGVVSFGYKCGLKDWPGVYTSVSAYDIWIKQNIRV